MSEDSQKATRIFRAGDDVEDVSTETTWKIWDVKLTGPGSTGVALCYNLHGDVKVKPFYVLKQSKQ